jgi:hypothetical protein
MYLPEKPDNVSDAQHKLHCMEMIQMQFDVLLANLGRTHDTNGIKVRCAWSCLFNGLNV